MDVYTKPVKRARMTAPKMRATTPTINDMLPNEILSKILVQVMQTSTPKASHHAYRVCRLWTQLLDGARKSVAVLTSHGVRRANFDLGAVAARFHSLQRLRLYNPYLYMNIDSDLSDDSDDIRQGVEQDADEDDNENEEEEEDSDNQQDDADAMDVVAVEAAAAGPPVVLPADIIGAWHRMRDLLTANPPTLAPAPAPDKKNESDSDIDGDSDYDAKSPTLYRLGSFPDLARGRYHPDNWNDAINPYTVSWQHSLMHLTLENIKLPPYHTWMRTLKALKYVLLVDVHYIQIERLVREHLVGCTETLEFLGLSSLPSLRINGDNRIDVFDLILRTFPKLHTLRLDHIPMDKMTRSGKRRNVLTPVMEHTNLRFLLLQKLGRNAVIPLHRMRLPNLVEITMKDITLHERKIATFPSVTCLRLGTGVRKMTCAYAAVCFPSLEALIVAQVALEVSDRHAAFITMPHVLLPKLQYIYYAVSSAPRDTLDQLARMLPAPAAGRQLSLALCKHVTFTWLYTHNTLPDIPLHYHERALCKDNDTESFFFFAQ